MYTVFYRNTIYQAALINFTDNPYLFILYHLDVVAENQFSPLPIQYTDPPFKSYFKRRKNLPM